MPKKEKVWNMGIRGPVGPWIWNVWIKGKKKPERIMAFDLHHIKNQLAGKQIIKVAKIPEIKENHKYEPMGPKGSTIHRPADYEAGFKAIKEWLDQNGGIPEKLRKKLREFYIDYVKDTRSSAKKNGRHKI
tara:strand:+ start:1424 stop:1816 length:393 start_codon:yes stop_codon:yes gene_type:complete